MPYEENSGFIFLVKGKMFGPSRRTLPEREDGRDGLSWNLMDGFSSGGLGPQWPIIPLQRLAELATSLLFAQMQLGGFFLGSRHPAIPRNFLLDFALRNGLRCLGQFQGAVPGQGVPPILVLGTISTSTPPGVNDSQDAISPSFEGLISVVLVV